MDLLETLTDSEDELTQLEREYERKRTLLLEKKRHQKNTTNSNDEPVLLSRASSQSGVHISDTPPSSPKKEDDVSVTQLQKPVRDVIRDRHASSSSLKYPKSFNGNTLKPKKQSSFGALLLDASGDTPTKFNVDLQDRIFGFTTDEIPRLNEMVEETDEYTREPIIRRYTDKTCVSRLLQQYSIKLMSLKKFYAKCSPPSYTEPNYVNWMVCGFVLSKPELCTTRDGKNKYLKFFFGDWNTDIGVIVFDKAVSHYMHLVAGEIIMILNPGITRKPSNGIQFKAKDNIKNVVSIGLMKNYGKCKKCSRAINTAKGDLCQVHLEQQYRSGMNRMELNGAVSLQGPGSTQERRFKYSPPEEITRTYSGGNSINRSKYDDPNLLLDLGRKRKHDDEKANQLLESKLMKIANPTATSRLRDLGIISEKSFNAMTTNANHHYQNALTSENIKDLGFNPLLRKSSNNGNNGNHSSGNGNSKSSKLQELLTIAKKERTHKSLLISRHDFQTQQGLKTKSIERLRQYKQSLQKQQHVELYDDLDLEEESSSNKIAPITTSKDHGAHDEDDLDIDFGSESAKQQYQKLREAHVKLKLEPPTTSQ